MGAAQSDYVLTTSSGLELDLDHPRSAQIALEDIASALSKVCRFGAQAQRFYSVAQHAILVCDLVIAAGRPDLALVALHHDDHEAYACDIPSPLKVKMRAGTEEGKSVYDEICDAIDGAIAEKFGISFPSKETPDGKVREIADRQALLIEAAHLLYDQGEKVRAQLRSDKVAEAEPLPLSFREPVSPACAEKAFRDKHREARELVPGQGAP